LNPAKLAGTHPVSQELIERFPSGPGPIANIVTGTDNSDLAACRRLSYVESRLRADRALQPGGGRRM
jgi:hypothetical protein